MATPASADPATSSAGGLKQLTYRFSFTAASTSDVITLTGVPATYRICRAQLANHTGTATSHQMELATTSGGTKSKIKYQATSVVVATDIDDPGASNPPIAGDSEDGKLYLKLTYAGGGSDNTGDVVIILVEGAA